MPAIIAGKVPKMIGPTLARDNHQGIPTRMSATTTERRPPPVARRGERFFAPTISHLLSPTDRSRTALGCAAPTMILPICSSLGTINVAAVRSAGVSAVVRHQG